MAPITSSGFTSLPAAPGTLYVGVTGYLGTRIMQHKIDSIEGFTKKYKVHRLVYYESYEHVMTAAVDAAKQWRQVPAPKRGEAVRLMAEELRLHKDPLGSLVSLENGKIKAEGDGEVQEMPTTWPRPAANC